MSCAKSWIHTSGSLIESNPNLDNQASHVAFSGSASPTQPRSCGTPARRRANRGARLRYRRPSRGQVDAPTGHQRRGRAIPRATVADVALCCLWWLFGKSSKFAETNAEVCGESEFTWKTHGTWKGQSSCLVITFDNHDQF